MGCNLVRQQRHLLNNALLLATIQEPDLRIELRTYRLQGGCSTTELIRQNNYSDPSVGWSLSFFCLLDEDKSSVGLFLPPEIIFLNLARAIVVSFYYTEISHV